MTHENDNTTTTPDLSVMCLPFYAATYVRVPYCNTSALPNQVRKAVKRRRRRKMNEAKTLLNYEKRIRECMIPRLHELEGAYLSTFSVFSTEKECCNHLSNNAFVLMKIAREHGVHVKAVTSECKVGGHYRAPLLDGDTRASAKIVYVGNYNYFTQHTETDWSIAPADKVFYGLE